jgi:hypothetical protein
MRLKKTKVVKDLGENILRYLKNGAFIFAISVFIIGFIVFASQFQIFGLYLLEILLFGNLILMVLIIPVSLILRK